MSREPFDKKPVILYVSTEFFEMLNAYHRTMNNVLKRAGKSGIRRNDLLVEALQDWADKVGMNCKVSYDRIEKEKKK